MSRVNTVYEAEADGTKESECGRPGGVSSAAERVFAPAGATRKEKHTANQVTETFLVLVLSDDEELKGRMTPLTSLDAISINPLWLSHKRR